MKRNFVLVFYIFDFLETISRFGVTVCVVLLLLFGIESKKLTNSILVLNLMSDFIKLIGN